MTQNPQRDIRIMAWLGTLAAIAFVVIWIIRSDTPKEADSIFQTDSASHAKISQFKKPEPPRRDYIGSAACAQCHPQVAETYRTHSMSRSLAAVSPDTSANDGKGNSFAPDAHHTYRVETTPEGIFHHERLTDMDGQEIYDQRVRVDYALGSGHQGRSYLIDRGGTLFMSPITWYGHAARWDLSPQYKLPVHRRFERPIFHECLDCHSGQVNSIRGSEIRFQAPPFLEAAISCERCHGPGGEHASLHRSGLVDRHKDPIVNPSKLEPAPREDVCAQCHLQGESTFYRYGCEVDDFRPGQRLEETRTVFVNGTRVTAERTTRAISHVEQMRVSRCFEASEGRFGCTSCHDAHSRPEESQLTSFYRKKCLACHDDKPCGLPEPDRVARQADDSCTACHMPRLGANDVPHTAQTDHRVQRKPVVQRPSNEAPRLPEIYDGAEQRLPRLVVDYARGLWLAEHAEKRTDSDMASRAYLLLTLVEKEIPDDARLLDSLGIACAVLGRFDEAMDYWKKTLEIEPDRENTLETVAILAQNSGQRAEARPYLERALKLNPWKSSLWGLYAKLLGQENEINEAIIAAKKAQELDPSVPQTYQFLAEACRRAGRMEESQQYRDQFERIQRVRK